MKKYRLHAVVIHKRNLGESDRLLTVFSKEFGKMTLIAKGVRKLNSRRSSSLELLNHVLLDVYRGSSLDGIYGVSCFSSYPYLKQNLNTISTAVELIEIINLLTPEAQEHTHIYEILVEFLDRLEKKEVNTNVSYKVHVLRELGYYSDSIHEGADMESYIEEIAGRKLNAIHAYE